ncbi:MAG TPA: hypothetical protein VMG40_02115 [Bryobacteraceae bacterium]|nr:hypothetical protein [Bryobacteraceae bacterium]
MKFLESLRLHPRLAWAGLLIYAAAVTFPHEQVQLLVGKIADLLTRPGLYRLSAAVALVLAAWATVMLFRRLRGHSQRRTIAAYWALTLFLIWCNWRVFTANDTELVHYPQYFPAGAVLMAMTLSPVESLAWIALLGGLDEAYQYWVLYPRRVSALDFNDIYMDLLGGAAGMVFAAAFLYRPKGRVPIAKRAGVLTLAAVIASGFVLRAIGVMALRQDEPAPHWFALSRQKPGPFWSVVPALGPHYIHELTPLEGTLLILATIAVYGVFERIVSRPS